MRVTAHRCYQSINQFASTSSQSKTAGAHPSRAPSEVEYVRQTEAPACSHQSQALRLRRVPHSDNVKAQHAHLLIRIVLGIGETVVGLWMVVVRWRKLYFPTLIVLCPVIVVVVGRCRRYLSFVVLCVYNMYTHVLYA